MSVVTDRCADSACGWIRASNVVPMNQLENKTLAQRNIGNRFVPQLDLGVRQQRAITAQFNRVHHNEPPKKHSVFKPKDREGRLELGSVLCYAMGLLLVLLSWAMASEIVFTLGAFLLAGGAIFFLALGINNVTHSFTGYMTIFTVLGAIYLIIKFGYLTQLVAFLLD